MGDDRVAPTATDLEARHGHPGDLWRDLQARVQDEAIEEFSRIEADWLGVMWSLDAYRIAGVAPRGMGKTTVRESDRLAAIYRTKGNWFATLMALLLQNRTDQPIPPRTKVQGMSQVHK